eukprot:744579-Rhodomonas_salina.1
MQDGIHPLSPSQGIETLMQVMRHPPGPVVTVCPLDPRKLPDTPYFSAIRVNGGGDQDQLASAIGATQWLVALTRMDDEERYTAIESKIREEALRVAGVGEL